MQSDVCRREFLEDPPRRTDRSLLKQSHILIRLERLPLLLVDLPHQRRVVWICIDEGGVRRGFEQAQQQRVGVLGQGGDLCGGLVLESAHKNK